MSCSDALTLLAAKHDTITALIAEAEDRKRRIEALMTELRANKNAGAPVLASFME